MRDLDGLWPAVHSVSIVPVGLTKFRDGLYPLTPFTPALAAGTIAQVTAFGDRCLREHGSRVFFCGDELYLEAGLDLPPDEFYEEHTQLENGVGMTTGDQRAETDFSVDLDGEDSSANVVSRSVAKDTSRQVFRSIINGNNKCAGHTECDAIIMHQKVVEIDGAYHLIVAYHLNIAEGSVLFRPSRLVECIENSG